MMRIMTARGLLPAVALAVLGAGVLGACSTDESPTVLEAPDLTCDVDFSSDVVKDTVERVGGRRTDDYVVAFAKGTEIGVVALVDGDAEQAYEDLGRLPQLAVVAEIGGEEDPGTIGGFTQVQTIVDDTCGA